MTLWEGKVIYSDVSIASQPGGRTTSRIVEHDLATGRETVLIEARPPRTSAYVLHRSGDWLFCYEGGTTESGPAAFDPPAEYYALDLRSGQRRHLLTLRGRSCIGYSSGPNLSGSAFGDDGFAYIAANTSSSECRDQLRLYNLGSGEDRLLFEVESADTVLDSPLLRSNTVVYNQAWRQEWPRDVTPTPIPGRPDRVLPRYRITGDIFSLDLETGKRVNLSNSGSASQPALWDDYLMYIDEPVRAAQEHGSGEVYVLNLKTGQRQKLTDDATYMHLYSSPLAGEGFFVWQDAHLDDNEPHSPIWQLRADGTGELEGIVEDGFLIDAIRAWQ
jgi:outer membrane protein assembly factor BamB